MAGAVSCWLGAIEYLPDVALRFENRPAIEVIRLYDSHETLFYCDPPYIHKTRGDNNAYAYEMSDEEHRKLALVLNSIQGLVAISGYDCDLMTDLYPSPKWYKSIAPTKTIHSTKDERTEILWTNYDPKATNPRMLF